MVLGSYLSLCIVTDMTLLYLTLLIYLVQANTVQRARDVRPVFGPMLGQRSGRWASIGPALGWCPVFAGRVSTLCWFSVGPCLRRCPGTAPTLGRSWCLLGFTILCNNVDFWLFRSAYMFFFFTTYFFFYYIHFGVTYKPKWAGYYIVNIFILSLNLFVHVTIIKIYNTIQYIAFVQCWARDDVVQMLYKCFVFGG